jgi:hypothetical protein
MSESTTIYFVERISWDRDFEERVNDDPGVFYRDRYQAQVLVNARNENRQYRAYESWEKARALWQANHDRALKEHAALVAAGLRDAQSNPPNPGWLSPRPQPFSPIYFVGEAELW